MKIGIVVSDRFGDVQFLYAVVHDYLPVITTVVGRKDCAGDRVVSNWVDGYNNLLINEGENNCITKLMFEEDEEKYGEDSDLVLNDLVLSSSDIILAFWDGEDEEIGLLVEQCIESNKKVNVYIRKEDIENEIY